MSKIKIKNNYRVMILISTDSIGELWVITFFLGVVAKIFRRFYFYIYILIFNEPGFSVVTVRFGAK